MKSLTGALALSLTLILSLLFLTACATPAKEPADAKKALEDNGYTVTLTDSAEKLEDGMKATLVATNKDGEKLLIVWYTDKDGAKQGYDDAKAELEALQAEDAEAYAAYVVGKSGTIVWMATSKNAVQAAK